MKLEANSKELLDNSELKEYGDAMRRFTSQDSEDRDA